ncbi:MerR family DNA-binding transcriptional regulator [Streptomyces sp. ME08-AFT2]|uniref:MerR family DNA-binding transcriptional regulator n=1 Tax=Streptomyces sp. ME08-AFT2 TaxID=3028683 RepID=UPI0029AC298E|nr:MerR family DNA-binding transcriptional regulator [Streptomyces sp. ME08-AFT2]MDX3308149.1 MerR family DNA-binding transcriptional regulator [Streptomyces sp. ME08-AFT2]
MVMPGMTIGQAAQAAGLTRKAVRIYEAKGLLPRAERSAAGCRLGRRRAADVHPLGARRGGTAPCDAVCDLLDARIAEIDATITDFLALRQALVETRRTADDRPCGEPATVCSIIEDV